MAATISSRSGSGVCSSSASADISWPGVQKPHWKPSSSVKALRSRSSSSPLPLDRAHRGAVAGGRQRQARQHRPVVDQHRAAAAGALAAGDLGAGQAERPAQHGLGERPRGVHLDRVADAVDVDRDLHGAEPSRDDRATSHSARPSAASVARFEPAVHIDRAARAAGADVRAAWRRGAADGLLLGVAADAGRLDDAAGRAGAAAQPAAAADHDRGRRPRAQRGRPLPADAAGAGVPAG